MRVLIADDHEMVRHGIRALIEHRPGWQICAEATNGQEAVDLAVSLQPDLIVLDLSMPVMNGLQAAKKIRELAPVTKIIVLSMHDSPHARREAEKAGAHAYVSKTAAATELSAAIKSLGLE
jgi:DNA-binding NarL/FixJ family response regulator